MPSGDSLLTKVEDELEALEEDVNTLSLFFLDFLSSLEYVLGDLMRSVITRSWRGGHSLFCRNRLMHAAGRLPGHISSALRASYQPLQMLLIKSSSG